MKSFKTFVLEQLAPELPEEELRKRANVWKILRARAAAKSDDQMTIPSSERLTD